MSFLPEAESSRAAGTVKFRQISLIPFLPFSPLHLLHLPFFLSSSLVLLLLIGVGLLPCPTFPLLLVILLPPENLFQQVNLLLLGVDLLLLLLILLLLIGVGLLLLCVDLSLLLLVSPFTFSEINQSKLTQLN